MSFPQILLNIALKHSDNFAFTYFCTQGSAKITCFISCFTCLSLHAFIV